MTEVNPKNGNETKLDVFSWDIFKFDIIFTCSKRPKYFNDFHNCYLSISLQKQAQTKIKIKQDIGKYDNIFPYLQSRTLFK